MFSVSPTWIKSSSVNAGLKVLSTTIILGKGLLAVASPDFIFHAVKGALWYSGESTPNEDDLGLGTTT